MSSATPFLILGQLIFGLPLLIVCIIGIALAARWRTRAPTAAMFTILGLAALIAARLVFPVLSSIIIVNAASGGSRNVSSIGTISTVISFVSALVQTAGVALLVAAVFANRQQDIPAFPVGAPPMATLATHSAQ